MPAGGDAAAQTVLRRAGERMRDIDCAVAAAVGFAELNVRMPRIWIARGRATTTPLIDAGVSMLARFAGKSGAATHGELTDLHEALARDEADAVIAIGGTGSGRDDESVRHWRGSAGSRPTASPLRPAKRRLSDLPASGPCC